MTDNEIIKALKCYLITNKCTKLGTDILDLINRQKSEIERLQSMNQAKLDMIHDIRAELETAKSEAIREFAEKLKTKIAGLEVKSPNETYKCGMEDVLYYRMPIIINNLVKEMTEESND